MDERRPGKSGADQSAGDRTPEEQATVEQAAESETGADEKTPRDVTGDAPGDATGEESSTDGAVGDCWNGETLSVTGCTRCPDLVDSRSQIVDGVGPPDADLLFVGEAPGATEDERGEPFVGRSGDVLDDALRAVGLDRTDVRITNCVRCRPPDNRDPTAEELGHCRGYLEAEMRAVDPELVVTLGKVPAEHLLGRSVAVTSEAGSIEPLDVGPDRVRVLLSVHPAATLYDPGQGEVFSETIARAAEYAGDGGQATFGDFG